MTVELVAEFLFCSTSTVWNKLQEGNAGFDASFPKPHPMNGEARAGNLTRWRAGLIMDWNRKQSESANPVMDTKSTK